MANDLGFIADNLAPMPAADRGSPAAPNAASSDFVEHLAVRLGSATRRNQLADEARDSLGASEAYNEMDGLERAIEGCVASSLPGVVAQVMMATGNLGLSLDYREPEELADREELVGRSLRALQRALPVLADLGGVDLLAYGADWRTDAWKYQERHRGKAERTPEAAE